MSLPENAPTASRFKIAVVEDDLTTLELLRDVLVFQGFEVLAFDRGETASAVFEREAMDAIFLDHQMPGLSGLELCQLVRKSARNRSTTVVMITGSEDRKLMEGAFAAGITLFLTKPIDRPKLLNLLKTVRGRMIARPDKK